jgi:hypothetical protein
MMKKTTIWWGIALLWCLGIALATRQPFFTGESTKKLMTNPLFDSAIINFYGRKLVHLSAFGLLALFFWLALAGKSYRYALAWALATFYGAIDEWHQSFIPERSGLVKDVLIDSVGAFLTLAGVYWYNKRK